MNGNVVIPEVQAVLVIPGAVVSYQNVPANPRKAANTIT